MKTGDKVRVKSGLVHGKNEFIITRKERRTNFKGNGMITLYYIDNYPLGYKKHELEVLP